MDVTIVIATFGDARKWRRMAERTAVPSAGRFGVPVVQVHADTLHDARNQGLAQVGTEWVCFLDADDELEPGYFDAMAAGTKDVRAPAVRYVRPNGLARVTPGVPRVAGHTHDCSTRCLLLGNWVVIGAVARAGLLRDAGGFDDHAWSEDWCLWSRCWLAGGSFEPVPSAVYRAHVRPDSRNRGASAAARLAAHREIAAELGFPIP